MKRTKIINASGIYQIQSMINDKIYIGSAVNLKRRLREHLHSLRKKIHGNRYLQRHVNKYGLNDLQFSILEFCSKEKLIEREQYYIDVLNPEFNLSPTANSLLGIKRSEEFKQKCRETAILLMSNPMRKQRAREMTIKQFSDPAQRKKHSEIAKKRFAKKENNPMYGKHHSKETKRKISESKKGKRTGKDNSMYGKHHFKEAKQKQSEMRTVWYKTEKGLAHIERMKLNNIKKTVEIDEI